MVYYQKGLNMKNLFKLLIPLLVLLLIPFGSTSLAKDAQLTDFRWTSRNDGNPPFVRIVMDLSKAVHAEAAMDDSGKNLEVILRNTSKGGTASQFDNMDKGQLILRHCPKRMETHTWMSPYPNHRRWMTSVFLRFVRTAN